MRGPRFETLVLSALVLVLGVTVARSQTVCGPDSGAVKPLMETHSLPPYPVDSVKNDEEGIVLVEVALGSDGVPTDTTLVNSSGHPTLDQQTLAWVKSKWRWRALPAQCHGGVTRISVKWDLGMLKTMAPASPGLSPAQPYDAEAITRQLLEHH